MFLSIDVGNTQLPLNDLPAKALWCAAGERLPIKATLPTFCTVSLFHVLPVKDGLSLDDVEAADSARVPVITRACKAAWLRLMFPDPH